MNIPDSNISDLISDAVRGRKNFNPTGSKDFFRVLSRINMPRDLVRNEERWKQADLSSSSGEEEIIYTSPQRTSTDSSSKLLLTPKRQFESLKSKLMSKRPRWHKYLSFMYCMINNFFFLKTTKN